MRKWILLYLVFPVALAATAQAPQPTSQEIESLFARYLPENPGCELAISRNGEVIFSKAWGMADLEHRVPLTTVSVTEAGSVSKQFTAAAMLLLEQQGKLSTDDDVRKYIPELPDYGTPVLLRYMMHHSSGLRDWGSVAAIAGWPRTTKTYNNLDALDIIVHQQALNSMPNEAYGYSNSNYNLFAIIVERVSGMSLAAFTRKYIFEPAGMTHTSWRDDHKRIVPGRAIAYSILNGVYQTDMPNEDVYGNGGLLTTAEDLLKWNDYYLGGRLGSPSLLPRQVATENLSNGKPNEYGAGLFLSNERGQFAIFHSGATASYRSFLIAYPKLKLSIAWLSNTSAFDGSDTNVVQRLINLLVYHELPASHVRREVLPEKKETFLVSAAELAACSGHYYSEEAQAGFTVQVKENGKLFLYRAPQTLIPLRAVSKDHWVTEGDGISGAPGKVAFIPGNGVVKGFTLSIDRASNVIFVKKD